MLIPEKARILIVDDVELNIKIAINMLKNEPYTIDMSNSGFDCIEKVKNNKYELILLDIIMPEIDGYETCRVVKSIQPDIPVIMLTGLTDNESLQSSFNSGAIDYIRKPFNKIELLSRIKNILGIKKAEKQMKEYLSKIEDDLKMAENVQKFLLPAWLISNERIEISSKYLPSQSVSGDLLEVINLSESKTLIYIGDISGHGVQAGLLMTAVKSIIRMLIEKMRENFRPYELVNEIHNFVTNKLFANNYMTFLVGIIDHSTDIFEFFNAGHPPIMRYRISSGICESVEFNGSIPVGWGSKVDFTYKEAESNSIRLTDDDILILYTDGIFECSDSDNNILGMNNFLETINKIKNIEEISVVPDKLFEELAKSGYNIYDDDVTFLAFKLKTGGKKEFTKFFEILPVFKSVRNTCSESEKLIMSKMNDPELAAKIELIIDEYLNNILVHGFEKKQSSNIYMEIKIADKIRIYIWDKGKKWQLKVSGKVIEESYQESGRGLAIINSLSEYFNVDRYGDINMAEIIIKP